MDKLVVLNHKDYLDKNEVKDYLMQIKDNIRTDIELVICPSQIYLPYFQGKYKFKLGAQNLSWTSTTGDPSAKQLKSMSVEYVIIGHPERRDLLRENNQEINKKIQNAIVNGIKPIICISETKEQRQMKRQQEVITKQIKEVLKDIDVQNDIIIAYEPIWLLKTNNVIKNKELEEIINLIKQTIFRNYNVELKVIYGGNINDKNIKELNKLKNLDGYIIGKESTKAVNTLKILNNIK